MSGLFSAFYWTDCQDTRLSGQKKKQDTLCNWHNVHTNATYKSAAANLLLSQRQTDLSPDIYNVSVTIGNIPHLRMCVGDISRFPLRLLQVVDRA